MTIEHAQSTANHALGPAMVVGATLAEWLAGHGFFSPATLIGAAGLLLTAWINLPGIVRSWHYVRGREP